MTPKWIHLAVATLVVGAACSNSDSSSALDAGTQSGSGSSGRDSGGAGGISASSGSGSGSGSGGSGMSSGLAGDDGGGTGDDGGTASGDDGGAVVFDAGGAVVIDAGLDGSIDAGLDARAFDGGASCPSGPSRGACLMTPAPGTTACTDYTGSAWAANAGGCGTGGGGPGTVVSACPTTNLLGRCGFACGTPNERIAFAYLPGGGSAQQEAMFCAAAGGRWLGK